MRDVRRTDCTLTYTYLLLGKKQHKHISPLEGGVNKSADIGRDYKFSK